MLRTRIAPTPSGYLHIGNGFSFLMTALLAKKCNGSILLRIDDIDSERTRPEYVEDIFTSLEWLGIEWQEGPSGPDDFTENWSQHRRISLYNDLLSRLRQQHAVFGCECSRKKLAAVHGAYPGFCENLNIPFDPDTIRHTEISWRCRVPADTSVTFSDLLNGETTVELGKESGSFVVRKRDGLPSYHLVSLADDTHFRINFLVRGEDLILSTATQLFLADTIGIKSFSENRFLHHKLEKDAEGHKLSKTAGSISLQYMRRHGIQIKEVYSLFLEQFAGIKNASPSTFEELYDAFFHSESLYARVM